jgi:4-nitrophenyl phosphatase
LLGGALFIGTNPDLILPHDNGFVPGAGTILSAIEAASGVAPEVVGKPQPDLLFSALDVLKTRPECTLMIGDQLATDIAAGRTAGLKTLLVHTGAPVDRTTDIHADFELADLSFYA